MRYMTRQDHIDPLVYKVQKCGASGCGPNSIMVLFTRPRGEIVEFNHVWVCSTGHCSDYDEIPDLRKPEDDPYAWLKENARALMNHIEPMKCDAHAAMNTNYPHHLIWGQEGHLYYQDGILYLCLPMTKG